MNRFEHGTEAATNGGRAYGGGLAVVAATAFLTVWTMIVRDDGTGAAYFMIILAAGVAGYAVRLRPQGLARAMLGVAGMQLVLGLLTATAPITAQAPGGPIRALVFNAVFAALWLVAGALFRAASGRREAQS